jgi:hypothetical protein
MIGQKRPLKPKEVWAIRLRLQLEGQKRDLALFNLAIDSKLRGCDLVSLQVDDVCAAGRVRGSGKGPSQQLRRFWRAPRLPSLGRPTKLFTIPPDDCGGRPQPDSDAAALVDKRALGGNSSDDILGGQYRRHFAAILTGVFASNAMSGVKRF